MNKRSVRTALIVALALAAVAACGPGRKSGVAIIADEPADAHGPAGQTAPPGPNMSNAGIATDPKLLSIVITHTADIAGFQTTGRAEAGPGWVLLMWPTTAVLPPYQLAVVVRSGTVPGPLTEGALQVLVCTGTARCAEKNRVADAKLRFQAKSLIVQIPFRVIPKITEKFGWASATFWGGGTTGGAAWRDSAPDAPDDDPTKLPAESRANFPQRTA